MTGLDLSKVEESKSRQVEEGIANCCFYANNWISLCLENRDTMTTLELKNALIQRITEINDQSILKAIKAILDAKVNDDIIILSPEQKAEILQSKLEISAGNFVDNEDVQTEVDKWLQEK